VQPFANDSGFPLALRLPLKLNRVKLELLSPELPTREMQDDQALVGRYRCFVQGPLAYCRFCCSPILSNTWRESGKSRQPGQNGEGPGTSRLYIPACSAQKCY